MSDSPSIVSRFIERIFPKAPNFFVLLHEQCSQVCVTVDNLVRFIETSDLEAGKQLKADEHQADKLRIRNLQALNQAFSTDIDREDIYRAIDAMDGIVTHCKNSYNEMKALQLHADSACLDMVRQIQEGVRAIEQGLAILEHNPLQAQPFTMTARHQRRRIEKRYYKALSELFVGDDYLHMFKMREFYRHLEHIANRMHLCANVVEDVIVKIS